MSNCRRKCSDIKVAKKKKKKRIYLFIFFNKKMMVFVTSSEVLCDRSHLRLGVKVGGVICAGFLSLVPPI